METIRNYLETMFANLPNTAEVLHAKNELLQMMEDKYNELIAEGKSDNEAVGTVIAEFGNLDEISEDLGIHSFVSNTDNISRRTITLEETKQYLHDRSSRAFKLALGVFLCIISVIGPILSEAFSTTDALGIFLFMGCIAVAIVLFVYSSITIQRWDFLKQEPCAIDFATTNYVHEQKERYRTTYALLLTIGIVLCVISFVPAAILDEFDIKLHWIDMDDVAGILLFLLAAIGVFMIILGSCINNSFDNLLKLNNAATVGGNFVPAQQPEAKYISPAAAAIMSVYWTTVLCVYLIWSFLTFDWAYTWIIWPVAAIIHAVLNNTLRRSSL